MPSGSEIAAEAARKARGEKGRKSTGFKVTSILGALVAAQFSKEKGMGRYSKFFGTIIGGGVGIALSYLASRGLASCSLVDGVETCSLWGMSQAQITGFLVGLFGSLGTFVAPPNSPVFK